jgi:soluble lytic murein transglycosylase-like protein
MIKFYHDPKSKLLFQKTIIWFLLFVISCFCLDYAYNSYKFYASEREYAHYHKQYPWLTHRIYDTVIAETGAQSVPLPWMLAIIHSESRGSQYAVSSAGAIGLGQVMPFHYRGRKEALFDIDLNIMTSVGVFRQCLDMHKGNLVRALNTYEGHNKRPDINVKYLSEIIENIYFPDQKQ